MYFDFNTEMCNTLKQFMNEVLLNRGYTEIVKNLEKMLESQVIHLQKKLPY